MKINENVFSQFLNIMNRFTFLIRK